MLVRKKMNLLKSFVVAPTPEELLERIKKANQNYVMKGGIIEDAPAETSGLKIPLEESVKKNEEKSVDGKNEEILKRLEQLFGKAVEKNKYSVGRRDRATIVKGLLKVTDNLKTKKTVVSEEFFENLMNDEEVELELVKGLKVKLIK